MALSVAEDMAITMSRSLRGAKPPHEPMRMMFFTSYMVKSSVTYIATEGMPIPCPMTESRCPR